MTKEMAEGMDELKEKYEQIAAYTRPKCLTECPEPGACCRAGYCAVAAARAKELGAAAPVQRHATLPFMGPAGCVLSAYLRPLCAVHVCEIHLLGGGAYADGYFALREEVLALEERLGPSWPDGVARNYWE